MDIIKSIDRFIDHRMYHYALLINGKWGCGKTYFIRHELMNYLHDKKPNHDVNYLSLYGIKSTNEITQMLCVQAMKDKAPEAVRKTLDTKAIQITTGMLSAFVKGGMNVFGVGETGIERIIQNIPNFDNNIIIFDDLERCSCPINEVFGYINNFVEHSDASVILVANEDEIGKWQLDSNPEMQTFVAMDSRVNVELPPKLEDYIWNASNRNKSIKDFEKKSFTPDEIEYRRRAIFHNDEEYKAIKEKVIGLTINYEPDLKLIFTKLIEDNIKIGSLNKQLLAEIDWFEFIAEKDDHKNLRTFQYFLEKISIIFKAIEYGYPSLHKILIRYTYRSAIRYMKGQKMPKWDGDYGMQEFGSKNSLFYDQEFGFKFIDELLQNNTLNVGCVNEVLERYEHIAEKKGQLSNDPYQLINNWWISEDEKVSEWLDKIEKNIKSGVYSTALFTNLIKLIAQMKNYHVMDEKCDLIFSAMKEYIKSADPSVLEDFERERFILDEETGRLYDNMSSEITKLLNDAKMISEKQKYEEAIKDTEHWASNLLKSVEKKRDIQGHSFIYWLEPEQILSRIIWSNNSELDFFRHALQCLYGDTVYYEHGKDDYEHLKTIKDGFINIDTASWGQVKMVYRRWLAGDFERYLERIKPEDLDSENKVCE